MLQENISSSAHFGGKWLVYGDYSLQPYLFLLPHLTRFLWMKSCLHQVNSLGWESNSVPQTNVYRDTDCWKGCPKRDQLQGVLFSSPWHENEISQIRLLEAHLNTGQYVACHQVYTPRWWISQCMIFKCQQCSIISFHFFARLFKSTETKLFRHPGDENF